jgi:hypothetical protein
MRGRLATNCGYLPADINELPLSFVHSLARYWAIEPPPSLLLKWFVGYEPKDAMNHSHSKEINAMYNKMPGGKSFDQLPRYIQLALIEHSGLSEPDFHKQRQERRKRELLAAKVTK